jgi:hypothetical protein
MSEPTLYRTNEPHAEEIHILVEVGMLTLVEPDLRPLADALHHELCKQNHTDGCSYYYHQWSDELPEWHPKHYWLKTAEKVFSVVIGEKKP